MAAKELGIDVETLGRDSEQIRKMRKFCLLTIKRVYDVVANILSVFLSSAQMKVVINSKLLL